nr:hypothetical protein [Roseitranquillus sediminis]
MTMLIFQLLFLAMTVDRGKQDNFAEHSPLLMQSEKQLTRFVELKWRRKAARCARAHTRRPVRPEGSGRALLEPVKKNTELRKDLPPRRKHGSDREIARRRTQDRHGNKPPARDLVLSVPGGELRQSAPANASRQESVNAARRETTAHRYRSLHAIDDELPVGGVGPRQALMICEILDGMGRAVPFHVRRGGVDQLGIVCDPPSDETRVLEWRNPDREVPPDATISTMASFMSRSIRSSGFSFSNS